MAVSDLETVVLVVFGETEKRRSVLRGQLISCSPVFSRMLCGEFKEGTAGEVHIGDVEIEAMDLFLDLLEYPRCGSSLASMAAKLKGRLGSISDILDKYDCGSLVQFIKDLIEYSPVLGGTSLSMRDIQAFEQLSINTADSLWSQNTIKFIATETMSYEMIQFAKRPRTDAKSLSALSGGTLVQILEFVNKTKFKYKNGSQELERALFERAA